MRLMMLTVICSARFKFIAARSKKPLDAEYCARLG